MIEKSLSTSRMSRSARRTSSSVTRWRSFLIEMRRVCDDWGEWIDCSSALCSRGLTLERRSEDIMKLKSEEDDKSGRVEYGMPISREVYMRKRVEVECNAEKVSARVDEQDFYCCWDWSMYRFLLRISSRLPLRISKWNVSRFLEITIRTPSSSTWEED